MAERVEIFEVGPRDGLQNEARLIPVDEKIALVDCLSRAGFRRIECASFVSPKWVPQMADSAAVLTGIKRAPGVSYAALTPNMRGFEDAMLARASEVAIFGSASEGFSKANINASIAESLERFAPVAEVAAAAGVKLRGYVSCVVECPLMVPSRRTLLRGWWRRCGTWGVTRCPWATRSGGPRLRVFPRCLTPSCRKCRQTDWRGITTTQVVLHVTTLKLR